MPNPVAGKACPCCRSSNVKEKLEVQEMFLGLRLTFVYVDCGRCRSLYLKTPPEDMGPFYDTDLYYSFHDIEEDVLTHLSPIEKLALRAVSSLFFREPRLLNFLPLEKLIGPDYCFITWLAGLGLRPNSRILDVGCGNGELLLHMRRAGFNNLEGIDPYIRHDITYKSGVRVRKMGIEQVYGKYRCIMMNHSLEHLENPSRTLRRVADLLLPEGQLLIRLPIAGSYAHRLFRENWYQIDAPRHFFVPSVAGMEHLAKAANFKVVRTFFDSDMSQIACSTAYANGVSMVSMIKGAKESQIERKRRMADDKETNRLRAFASQLNALNDGDQAGFLLQRS